MRAMPAPMFRADIRRSYDPATITLLLLLGLTGANAFFNAMATALGFDHPYTSFLVEPSDLFGDFFKVVRSYGDGLANASGGLDLPQVAEPTTGGYDPKSALATIGAHPHITHFHLMPLSTLLSVLALAASRVVALQWLFVGLCLTLLCYLVRLCLLAAGDRRQALAWLCVALASYPMLLMWTRGNLLAGLTDLLLLHASLLALRGRAPLVAALALTFAVEIRPNAAIFALPLLTMMWRDRLTVLLTGAIAGPGIGFGCLALAHRLYPAYDFPSFLAGLGRYYLLYVAGDDGLPYGSSLHGALKLAFGWHPALDWLATLLAVATAGGALWAFVGRRSLTRAELLFLTCSAYGLGSAVFADYHLLVFLIVPMAAAIDGQHVRIGRPGEAFLPPALLATALVLSPKNYLFDGPISAQVLFNPLLLAAAVALVLKGSLRTGRKEKGQPVAGPPLVFRLDPDLDRDGRRALTRPAIT